VPTLILLLTLLFTFSGCSSPYKNIPYSYTPAPTQSRNPLSAIAPLKIKVREFVDLRSVTNSLGSSLNSTGLKTGDILAQKPVETTLRARIITELQRSGHKILNTKPEFVISGAVNEFQAEIKPYPLGREYTALITLLIEIEDPSQRIVYSHEYRTLYRDKIPTAHSVQSSNQVFSQAVDKIVAEVVSDREIYTLFSKYQDAKKPKIKTKRHWFFF